MEWDVGLDVGKPVAITMALFGKPTLENNNRNNSSIIPQNGIAMERDWDKGEEKGGQEN